MDLSLLPLNSIARRRSFGRWPFLWQIGAQSKKAGSNLRGRQYLLKDRTKQFRNRFFALTLFKPLSECAQIILAWVAMGVRRHFRLQRPRPGVCDSYDSRSC